jgi:hypothetical protein
MGFVLFFFIVIDKRKDREGEKGGRGNWKSAGGCDGNVGWSRHHLFSLLFLLEREMDRCRVKKMDRRN